MYRKKHGIPAAGKTAAAPAAAAEAPTETPARPPRREAEAAPARSTGTVYGWLVKIGARGGEVDRIVVARDAAGACTAGASAGVVISVERLGEAIAT
jgi:hypothetical protein